VSAAEESSADFHAVPDDAATTMAARGGHRGDGTFEAVEDPRRSVARHLERLVIVVAALFASRHGNLLWAVQMQVASPMPLDFSRASEEISSCMRALRMVSVTSAL
jgi:hypothetical protein